MTPRCCAVPGCNRDALSIFCSECYFALPSKQAQWLVRWEIKIAREQDADIRQHMREQLHGYVQEAIRAIQKSGVNTASQAAPDSAGHQLPRLMAGANYRQVRA